jgi:hypothetical protein
MINELIKQQSWWKLNWKWFIPAIAVLTFSILIFLSTGLDAITANLTKAYADTALYENALQKVKAEERVIEIIGEIQTIDKFAILEGSVKYSEDNKTVRSSIRVKGTKGKGMMDIIADRVDDQWQYQKINFRIEKPIEEKQTIEIINTSWN